MKKITAIIIVVLAIGLGWFLLRNNAPVENVSPVPEVPTSLPAISLDALSNGKTISASKGQILILTLGNPGDGGYKFDNPEYDTSLLHLDTHTHANPTSGRAGDFGSDVWQFHAVADGATDLTITATQPWNNGDTSTMFKITIAVGMPITTAAPGEHCGGNMTTALSCGAGYHCAPDPSSHLPFGDVGGTCVKD